MSATWVHEDNVPPIVISEFESGLMPEVHVDRESSCNQLSFTAAVSTPSTCSATSQPAEKRRKLQCWISPSNSG